MGLSENEIAVRDMRVECLRLALKAHGVGVLTNERLVSSADILYDYVVNGAVAGDRAKPK